MTDIKAVVFDLGGVLIDWNPRHLYRRLFGGDDAAMEAFLENVCSPSWNEMQDAGRPFDDGVALLQRSHPEHSERIAAYRDCWEEMIPGPIDGMVELLREVVDSSHRVYALSNWSAETYPIAQQRFEFLQWFDDVVISGSLGMIKPDAGIFEHLIALHDLEPASTLFIDDSDHNVRAACQLGFRAHHFSGLQDLRADLANQGIVRGR